jgi:hypothetical protein
MALWVLLAIFIGNGIYDVLVARGIKEVLFRHALAESSAGPPVALAPMMRTTVHRATAVGLLWGGLVILVGVITIRLVGPSNQK